MNLSLCITVHWNHYRVTYFIIDNKIQNCQKFTYFQTAYFMDKIWNFEDEQVTKLYGLVDLQEDAFWVL